MSILFEILRSWAAEESSVSSMDEIHAWIVGEICTLLMFPGSIFACIRKCRTPSFIWQRMPRYPISGCRITGCSEMMRSPIIFR